MRSVQIYMVRPSGELVGKRMRSRLVILSLFSMIPVVFGVASYWYAGRVLGALENGEAARYLALSVGMAAACTGLFTSLGQIFLCADAVEELVKSGRNARRYRSLLSLTFIPVAAGLVLMAAALRKASSLTGAQNETVLEGCELFAMFAIGAFMAGLLPFRVQEDISTAAGFSKRIRASVAGHAAVVIGLVVALAIFRRAGIF